MSQAAHPHGWCPAGEVIKPDSWKCINDEGMPVHGRPFEKGNLYIRFLVQFPDTLSEQQVAALQQILPKPAQQQQSAMDSDDIEQVGISGGTYGCLPVQISGRSCASASPVQNATEGSKNFCMAEHAMLSKLRRRGPSLSTAQGMSVHLLLCLTAAPGRLYIPSILSGSLPVDSAGVSAPHCGHGGGAAGPQAVPARRRQ